jgi:hypothetical protein
MHIKAMIPLACFILFLSQVYGQQTTTVKKVLRPEEMLRKGKTEKIVGPLLIGAGAGIFIAALNTDRSTTLSNLGNVAAKMGFIATLGVAVSTAGIVVFSNGIKRVRKAKLMLSYEPMPFFENQSMGLIGLKISLPLDH